MADVGIFTKNADIQALAGTNAGATAKAVAATDIYVLNVEAAICVASTYDYSAAWTAGTLDATMKLLLTQTSAAKCAMNVVNADLTAMSGRERETILDYLNTLYIEGMKLLVDKDTQAYVIAGVTT